MDRVSRRKLLAGLALLPVALTAACSGDAAATEDDTMSLAPSPEPSATPPTATATPEPPFVVAAGEDRRMMMAGTAYETPLYIYGSGKPGQVLIVLGGVHGNEPGGWLAAEYVVGSIRPAAGALLVIPRANKVATQLFERTTDAMGDLNRSYPGDPGGKPMQAMAAEIIEVLREFQVTLALDLHESWAFYDGRPQNGTAFLGQTVATYPEEPGISIGKGIVDSVNQQVQAPREQLFYRDRTFAGPDGSTLSTPINPSQGAGSTSSLGFPRWVPNMSAILVEMGQQQPLERRVALHINVVREGMRLIGI